MGQETKCCTKCQAVKPLFEFYLAGKLTTRRQTKCKVCARAADKERYMANLEFKRAAKKVQYAKHRDKRCAEDRAWYAAHKEARRISINAWSAANRERRAESSRRLRALDPEKANAYTQKWKAANPGKAAAAARKWAAANPDKCNAVCAARKARKLKATPEWANKFFIQEIYHLSKLRTKATGVEHHVDHIVPLKAKLVCGLHNEFNLQVIPKVENLKKGNRVWPDMP